MTNGKDAANRFYSAFNSGDAPAFRALLTPNWTDHPEAPGQSPGPEGLIEVVALFSAAFEGLVITPETIVSDGSHVVARIRLQGKHVKDWAGHKASGRQVTFHGMDMHRLEGDRIAETWHFENYGGLDE